LSERGSGAQRGEREEESKKVDGVTHGRDFDREFTTAVQLATGGCCPIPFLLLIMILLLILV
jgi:hypothetical protein